MRGKKATVILVLLILGMMILTPSSANPLPSPNDAPGGGLLPGDLSKWADSNKSIFLRTETINVTVDQEKANVEALYVLKNEAAQEISLDIELPFAREPSNVQLLVNGKNTTFSRITIDGVEVPHTYPTFTSTHSIQDPHESILFSLSFDGYEEKQVNVTYSREYQTGVSWDDKIASEFRYIVGTSRWWKYPLESAHFEFWVLKKSFDRGAVVGTDHRVGSSRNISSFFINSTTKDYVCLSVVYTNWMPVDHDFLVCYWEKTKPFLQTKFGRLLSFLVIPTSGFLLSVTVVIGSLWLPKRFEGNISVKLVCSPLTVLFLLLSIIFVLFFVLIVLVSLSFDFIFRIGFLSFPESQLGMIISPA